MSICIVSNPQCQHPKLQEVARKTIYSFAINKKIIKRGLQGGSKCTSQNSHTDLKVFQTLFFYNLNPWKHKKNIYFHSFPTANFVVPRLQESGVSQSSTSEYQFSCSYICLRSMLLQKNYRKVVT